MGLTTFFGCPKKYACRCGNPNYSTDADFCDYNHFIHRKINNHESKKLGDVFNPLMLSEQLVMWSPWSVLKRSSKRTGSIP